MKLQYHCKNSRVVLTQACRVASVAVGFLWSAWYRWHAPVFLRNVFVYCCPTLYIPFICYQYCIFVHNIHLSFFGFGVKGLEPIVFMAIAFLYPKFMLFLSFGVTSTIFIVIAHKTKIHTFIACFCVIPPIGHLRMLKHLMAIVFRAILHPVYTSL